MKTLYLLTLTAFLLPSCAKVQPYAKEQCNDNTGSYSRITFSTPKTISMKSMMSGNQIMVQSSCSLFVAHPEDIDFSIQLSNDPNVEPRTLTKVNQVGVLMDTFFLTLPKTPVGTYGINSPMDTMMYVTIKEPGRPMLQKKVPVRVMP